MERRYPVGIQTFSEIISNGYVYVDKTDLVWQLAHYAKYIFLSRPRRFGKSVLCSTLSSYFSAEKELFKGLKIMDQEKEWKQYPVIHISLGRAKSQKTPEELRKALMWVMEPLAYIYGKDDAEDTPGKMLWGFITRAYRQTGRQAVVILDEYDAPLLDVLHLDVLDEMRVVLQEFYQVLKDADPMLKFCFITGITKFSQMSIFSTINNLTNVSMDTMFGTICGITEKELTTTLRPDVERLASLHGVTFEQMHEKLKLQYDGYNFTEQMEEVYNPYSSIKSFLQRKIANYWFDSGTPSFLIEQMKHFQTNIMEVDSLEVDASAFDQPTENMHNALPLLFQSGYLTIKDYDPEVDTYILSIPNQEVRIGYVKGLLPAYIGLYDSDVQTGFAMKFWRALKKGDVDLAMREMKAYMAGIPYVEGFKKKLAEAATREGFYEYTMYLVFSMLNVYARTQVKCAGGRVDMVVWMPDTVYVFELKTGGTPQQALRQIDDHSYAIAYRTDKRRVVKVGVVFNADTRVPEQWQISPLS